MNILGEAVVSVMGTYLEPSEGVYTNGEGTEATLEQYTQIAAAVVTFTALNNQNILNKTARDYLASTDWYITRQSETDTLVPADVLSLCI